MQKTVYLVYFDGLGYYAKNQPNYTWSYTDDPNLAAQYTNQNQARLRANGFYGSGFNGASSRVEKHKVETIITKLEDVMEYKR